MADPPPPPRPAQAPAPAPTPAIPAVEESVDEHLQHVQHVQFNQGDDEYPEGDPADLGDPFTVGGLPQCKIKRNYGCILCTYFTQNPRCYLRHLQEVHQEKFRIHECPHCIYASRFAQKLQRHISMVHDPYRVVTADDPVPARRTAKAKTPSKKKAPVGPRKRAPKAATGPGCPASTSNFAARLPSSQGLQQQQPQQPLAAAAAAAAGVGVVSVSTSGSFVYSATAAALAPPTSAASAAARQQQQQQQAGGVRQGLGGPSGCSSSSSASAAATACGSKPALAATSPGSATAASSSSALSVGVGVPPPPVRIVISKAHTPHASVSQPLGPPTAAAVREKEDDDESEDFADDDSTTDRLIIEDPEEDEDDPEPLDPEQQEQGDMNGGPARAGAGAAMPLPPVDDTCMVLVEGCYLQVDPETRMYKCSSCRFMSRTASLVTRHESVVHLKKKFYRCSKCTYVTHLKARYTKHYKYHTMPLIKCSECDFRTPYKWNLDRHLKNHGGAGAFRCAACSFSADIKQSLTVHEMNHHTPPVGGGDRPFRNRRCKVGGSDCREREAEAAEDAVGPGELELDELQDDVDGQGQGRDTPEVEAGVDDSVGSLVVGGLPLGLHAPDDSPGALGLGLGVVGVAGAAGGVVPAPVGVPLSSGGRVKPLRCSQCEFRSSFISEMSRHLMTEHGTKRVAKVLPSAAAGAPPLLLPPAAPAPPVLAAPVKRVPKPLPNLIPIAAKSVGPPGNPVNSRPPPPLTRAPVLEKTGDVRAKAAPVGSPTSVIVSAPGSSGHAPDDEGRGQIREKNSFFDQLKLCPPAPAPASAGTGTDGPASLVCVWCGHEAKCSSELVRHHKLHSGQPRGVAARLSSTRCQHCRHRCKSSADLVVHLKVCVKATEAARKGDAAAEGLPNAIPGSSPALDDAGAAGGNDDGAAGVSGRNDARAAAAEDAFPPVNRVFVWTNMPDDEKSADSGEAMDVDAAGGGGAADAEFDDADGEDADDAGTEEDADTEFSVPSADPSLVGVETAPGYGAVTTQNDFEASAAQSKILQTVTSLKKVFKCPHCSFWAATASRFHVHIVGHLNKKPFECSLCNYRSNWRWDITKHIRLKAVRDPSHEQAKVLMTDETGRRNYSKYNKYLMLMKVAEPNVENLMAGRQTKAVANGMQGNMAGPLEPVPILPAPPKLTRAPDQRPPVPVATPPLAPGTLRPPPPLQAASHIAAAGVRAQQPSPQPVKRQVDVPAPASKVASDPKKANTEIKKTVWRCKQCHFRDGDRSVVLTHVKGHYRQQQEAALAKLKNNSSVPVAQAVDVSADRKLSSPKKGVSTPLRCDTCPFMALSESLMQAHISYHKPQADAIFKCFFCPFYVNSKDDLLQHMNVHAGSPTKKDESNKSVTVKFETDSGTSETAQFSSPKRVGDQETSSVTPAKKSRTSCAGSPTVGEETYDSTVSSHNLEPPILNVHEYTDTPICWVLREGKFTKMFRCRYCPHVNLRKTNIGEHERLHGKRQSPYLSDANPVNNQYMPYHCTDCTYVCNNAGVLSSHMKVHSGSYPQAYGFVDPHRPENEQVQELSQKYKIDCTISPEKASSPKPSVDIGNENKLTGINLMSLLNPNQSLTDAVLAMKKKFNLELDGEPFAEPQEDCTESPPNSPLKQLNDGIDPVIGHSAEEKKLHFCRQCPARFLFRKELGIHARFHNLHLVHRCESCSYTARQRTHLQAHYKVHTDDYQERTNALLKMYEVHKEFPMPNTTIARDNMPGVQGTAWIVAAKPVQRDSPSASQSPDKKYLCEKCPATFFKQLALQHHDSLHGGDGPHKCLHCDYAVKTYGNLVKHLPVHGVNAVKTAKDESKIDTQESSTSGGDESFENEEAMEAEATTGYEELSFSNPGGSKPIEPPQAERDDSKENEPSGNSPLKNDEQFGHLINGSPDFVYPTYCRNGRIKEKKYKCPKCPSAFEKRDQYKVHLTLHGSKQRYTCNKCDYSVKYYANHLQHLRKHKSSEDAKAASNEDGAQSEAGELIPEDTENEPSCLPVSPQRSGKSTGGSGEKLSVADKQAIMIMQQRRAKRAPVSREIIDKNYWCSYCPYSSPRRDQVESHMKRHISVSGSRNNYVCEHCDYTVPNKHFLREHNKLHFDVNKTPRPDAFMICEHLELWAGSDFSHKNQLKGRTLIFQDRGPKQRSERFVPPIPERDENEVDGDENKLFINLATLEPEANNGITDKEEVDSEESITQNELEDEKAVSSETAGTERQTGNLICTSPKSSQGAEMIIDDSKS